jgi:hypothetical protein
MGKITQEATQAFHAGYEFKKDNTEVICSGNERKFYLHGNCIAKKILGDGLYLSHCGWTSNTTKERLNGILSSYRNSCIYQKNYQWYLVKDGKKIEFKDGWNKVD